MTPRISNSSQRQLFFSPRHFSSRDVPTILHEKLRSLSNKVTGNSSNVPPPQESRIAIYLVDLKLSRILHLFLARKNVTSWRNETSASYVLPPVQNLYQLTDSNYLPLLFTAKFSPRNFRH